MRISLNWLKEYIDLPVGPQELADKMTMLGLEIEGIHRPWSEVTQVFTGKILSIDPHPDADKLVVCKTDAGQEAPLQIVCGAKNMKVGDIVPTAIVGATLPGGFKIAGRKMRGIESQGMMCSAKELGLGEDHTGLMILDPNTKIGLDCISMLGLDDTILEIEITPNRGDWASMIGIARELSALFGIPYRIPEIKIKETGQSASEISSVTIQDPDLCPRYAGRLLNNATVKRSPMWMCQRLLAAGQRPISNIVDITNYVLLETGHPLHAFDYTLLAENRIIVRRAKPGETIITIDGETRTLTDDMLVIADAERPVAVAGVMGGRESEVGENTTQIFLESAWFNPISVRRTSRRLGLQTEASQRFQRGADIEMMIFALNRAAVLMQELGGAAILPGILDEYPAPMSTKTVSLRYARSRVLLGADVPQENQRNILTSLGFKEISSSEDQITVQVPSWRHDVSQEADLIEEVARLWGYENVPVSQPPTRQTEKVFAPFDAPIRKVKTALAGFGLNEIIQWTFSSPELVAKCQLPESYANMVALQNPLTEKEATMRSSLLPGLLQNASRNLNHGVQTVKAFEVGPVFIPQPGQDLPSEPLRLGIALTGPSTNPHWAVQAKPLDFYDLKGAVEAVLDLFNATPAFAECDWTFFQAGQSARILLNDTEVGVMGAVSKDVLKNFDLDQPVFVLELNLQYLFEQDIMPRQFRALPQFPPSLRDMAVIVKDDVPAGSLVETALQVGGKLLQSVDIFDVYRGKPVPDGKKSVALSLVFQSSERTLTDKDTQKAFDKILQSLQQNFEAELR